MFLYVQCGVTTDVLAADGYLVLTMTNDLRALAVSRHAHGCTSYTRLFFETAYVRKLHRFSC